MSEPYLPLYVGDYLRDTGYLTLEQHGAYFMLLMRLWSAGGSLPSDEAKLARIAGVSVKRWRPIWADLEQFFEVGDSTISHNRITAELKKAGALRAKRAAAGAKGGAAKALKTRDEPVANAVARQKQIIPDQEVRKEEPNGSSKKNGCTLPPDFDPDLQFAVAEGLSPSQAQSEAAKFRDYWNGIPGAKGRKKDWPGTWRNWVRSAVERMPRQRGSPPNSPRKETIFDFSSDLLAKLREAENGTESDAAGRSLEQDVRYPAIASR